MSEHPVKVKWTGDFQFIGSGSNKRSVVMSSKDEQNNTGISPSEMLLLGLAACSGYDVVSILSKQRQKLTHLEVEIRAEQEPDPPWTYTLFHLIFKLSGPKLKDSSVQRAIELSLEKYCSVAATVSGKADITFEKHIVEVEASEEE